MNNLYNEKYIQNKEYFEYTRHDVIRYLEKYVNKHSIVLNTVLEIGCGAGETGKELKKKFCIQHYYGVELMEDAALIAKRNIDYIFNGNIEDMCSNNDFSGLDKIRYDAILFLDVLEHLYDPWHVLAEIRKWMNPDALLICSIPNVANYYVIKKMIGDKFQYEPRGILDKTHIRFFTLHTIKHLLIEAGFTLIDYTDNNDLHILKLKFFNMLTFGRLKKIFISQYIITAKIS